MRMKMLLLFLAIKLLCGIFTTCEGQSSFPPKTATQQNTWGSSIASRAIDGNVNTCSLSAFAPGSSEYGWWQVDLGDVFTVNSVTVTSGSDGGSDPRYYQNFTISVGMTNSTTAIDSNIGLCYYFNNGSHLNSGIPTTFNCSSPLNGRYVTIKRRGGDRQDALGLCEVGIQYITVSSSSSSSSTTSKTTTSTTSSTSKTSTTSTASTTSTTSAASKPSTMSTTSTVSKPSTISIPLDTQTPKPSTMSTTLTTSTISTTSTSLEMPTSASSSSTSKTNQASAIIAAIVLGCILGVSLIVILILSIMHHRIRKESKKLQSASSVPKRANDADSINYETIRENDKPPVLSSAGIRNDIMYENEYQRASIYPPENRNESMYQNNNEMQ